MDGNTTQSNGLYDLMAWLEKDNNWKKVVGGAALLIVAVAAFSLYKWNHQRSELSANQELLTTISRTTQDGKINATADDYSKVAQNHPNTAAAERAHLLAASAAFEKGDFAKATSNFEAAQKSGEKSIQAQAAFGLAAVAEAQKNFDQAVQKYEAVSKQFPDENVGPQARLAIANIYEVQNKPDQAHKIYSEIENSTSQFEYWKGDAAQRRDRLESQFPNLKKNPASDQVIEVTTPPAPAATNK